MPSAARRGGRKRRRQQIGRRRRGRRAEEVRRRGRRRRIRHLRQRRRCGRGRRRRRGERRGAPKAPAPRPAPSSKVRPKEQRRRRRPAPHRRPFHPGHRGRRGKCWPRRRPRRHPRHRCRRVPARRRAKRHRIARPAAVGGQRRRDRVPHLGRSSFRPWRHAAETRERPVEAGRGRPRRVVRPADLAPDPRGVQAARLSAASANSEAGQQDGGRAPPQAHLRPSCAHHAAIHATYRFITPRPGAETACGASAYCERARSRRGPPPVGVRRTTCQ